MKRFFATVAVLGLCSCGAEDEGGNNDGEDAADEMGEEEEPVDERVEMPPQRPGVLHFATGEFVVEPGKDVMMCTHVAYDGPEIVYNNAVSLQGKGGHHVVVLGAKEPEAPGTMVDCSDGADMSKYALLMIPQELPPGYGTIMPEGTRLVLQAHYVNTTDKPILVRDVVELTLVPAEEVTHWAAPIATNHIGINVAPGEKGELTYDCTLENDVELLMIGGHMHEWGSRFELEIGPSVEELESFYLVDPWQAEFRDLPPVNLYLQNPYPLQAGTVLRTHCEWDNTLDSTNPLEFPHEMCTAFGIVGGTKDPIECRKGE